MNIQGNRAQLAILQAPGIAVEPGSWLYTLPASGATLLRAQMVIVRQGDHFFTLGMVSPSEGPDDARPEFQKLLDTLVIKEVPH